MTKPLVRMTNRLYVPEQLVTLAHKKAYTYWFGQSEYSEDPDDFEVVQTFRQYSNGLVGFPRGNLEKLFDTFSDFEIEDERSLVPHGFDLEFLGELRDEQKLVWRKWLAKQYGMMQLPPRGGKTALMVYAVCKLKQRSLVLAQEWSLLEQWEEEFRKFTNINELERQWAAQHGKAAKLIGSVKNPETDVYPLVTLASWQLYQANMPALLKNRDQWGAVFVDEAHSAASPCFSKVVGSINSYYRIPVTATPERKDGHEVVVFDIAGPVTAVGTSEQLPVHVKVVHTGIEVPNIFGQMGRKAWASLRRRLAHNEDRNELIINRVLADYRAGHKILVCSDLIGHLKQLQGMLIEASDKFPAIYGDLKVSLLIGAVKGKERKALRMDAKAGDVDVVLAYSKIVQLGWNVSPWSSLHNVLPMANEPNWYQRISRIRTPCDGCPGVGEKGCGGPACSKEAPVATIYVDANRVLEGCFKTQQRVHQRLGFVEQHEYLDAAPKVKRDPERKGRGLKWTEIL